jgi:single-stranded-DNA-specific exonuclease
MAPADDEDLLSVALIDSMPQITPRPYSAATAAHLEQSGIAPLLARIYAARGIHEAGELDTGLDHLLPFAQMMNIQRMAALLADAIAQNKKLLVIADYDADGATACAVALLGLPLLGARADFIVPNRFEYGYGLTPEIARLAAQFSPDMLITVDNGIASIEGIAEANRLGMQVLVTDHHLPADALPDALCIVNPNQRGCHFPSKNLAGVGVMFYALLALRAEMRARGAFAENSEPNLAPLLDLVALGTVADVVALDENNRILVQQGLQRIRAGRACAGINALLQIARKPPALASSYELGFIVGPRLNAAGRLEDMSLGIRCLLCDDPAEAATLAAQLDELNRARRDIEADMQETALAALENVSPAENYSLTLFDAGWHQGVIGILASRLKERFHRPVIAFARSGEGEIKGSGRSVPAMHLRDALDLVAKRHPHLLQKFGGHAMAAGLTLREADFAEFQNAFEAVARELLTPADLTQVIETDGELEAKDLTLDVARALERQVWGQGFPSPLFEGEFTVREQHWVGDNKHLKLKLESPTGIRDAIYFFAEEELPKTIRAVYSLGINEYKGTASLQFIVRHWETDQTEIHAR